jgi:iron complex outermembrane recepter protein
LKITLGGAGSYYYGEHYGKIVWAQFASNGNNDRNWYYSTGRKSDFNIFLKVHYQLLKKLNLFADLQYRNVNYTIEGNLETLQETDQNHIFNFFNPKAGVYYTINEHHNLYLSFAVGNREPNRNNYEVADSLNMPLPERLYDYELGYNLKSASLSAGVTLYLMNYQDQLVLTGKINTVGEPIMTNVPQSYRAGIEISVGYDISKWLKWNISTTLSVNKIINFTEYVDSYDSAWSFLGQESQNLGNTYISFSPGIIASNRFTFIPIRNMSISLNSRYIGRQYIDNTSSISRSLDPWFVNGLSLGYNLETKAIKDIGFTLSVNNLFSTKYETNGWVYRYYYANQQNEMNGYFPQALINFLFGVSLKI